MTVEKKSTTPYEVVRFIYSRDESKILSKKAYKKFYTEYEVLDIVKCVPTDFTTSVFTKFAFGNDLILWELKEPKKGITSGVITDWFEVQEFDEWFIKLLLTNSKLFYNSEIFEENCKVEDGITELFVRMLKHSAKYDKWTEGGDDYFKKTIKPFILRDLPIQAVLPAFPCKSSNLDKVAGWKPDKGEELSLLRLVQFTEAVKELYNPGIIIWIVSDGHVFSDCSMFI